MPEDLDEQVDALYGLPLHQFIAARDELGRRLRQGGERELAAEIKQLRRPSLVAWSLNRLRCTAPDEVQGLIAAGDELRRAQEQLLAGGGHGALREAAARERSAVQAVARLAQRELADAGRGAGPATDTKLWQTLQAAGRDHRTRELLSAGRLERETEISDLGLGGEVADDAPSVPRPRGHAPASTKPSRPRIDPALKRKIEAAQRRLEAARERQRELEDHLATSRREAVAARKDAERAGLAAERSQAKAEQAEEPVRRAGERVRELEAGLAEVTPPGRGGTADRRP